MKANGKQMAMSDEYLLEGCLKRDNSCREALYRKYSKDLYQYALRYASNSEEADDVLQEAFLLIFERIGQFRKEGDLLNWMRTVVIRAALTQYRRNIT
ncbi:MAG: RNA polymerase sigma factor [Bacteroidales bacterium]|nr:RNA polymerase sigma factor [Bacteroidales bacterium]